ERRPPRLRSTAWNVTQLERATTAIASRKCDMTSHGFRSKATVIAPSGTCATVPAAAAAATHATDRRRPEVRKPIHAVTTAESIAIPEMTRFENSTTAWYPVLGTRLPAVQFGQCGQPRPEAVSRTRPPVTTTIHSRPSVTTAA